jgi:Mrp family chromosome partitioning ATPase
MARDDGDPSHQDRAALCIHEIRALLEIRAQTGGAQAFAITSSGKGAGKTSLTVGLASSLALSGTRTLLVDCELAGRTKSTPSPNADPAKGQASPPQRLDEVMLLMGYLDEHDTDIFLLPEDARVGLVAMLDGDSLEQCVVHTSVPGLSILPAVSAQPHHIGKMSCHFIRRLIAEARQQYDMILFDTGPIPGSVEALFVASEVDEVILIVSRGELQNRVDKTIAHLKMIGARLAGTVFNRAVAGDVGMKEQTHPPRSGQNPPLRRANRGQNMGSGIFAAAVHAHARTDANPGGGVASENRSTAPPPPRPAEDDEAISPQDAGEMYRVLLRDEMDADESASPQTPRRNEAKRNDGANAINDVLDDLLDNVIASAERKMDPHKSGTAAPAAPTNPKTS